MGVERDWYADNVVELLIVFGASVIVFLVLSLILFVCLRLKFSVSQVGKRDSLDSLDSLDLTLAKSHTRAVRILSLAGILLQLTLVAYISNDSSSGTSTTQRVPYLFSLVRPVLNTCVYFLGFMTNTHGAFRVLFLVLIGAIVVSDTVAEVTLAMMIACRAQQGLQCGSAGYLFTDVATLAALRTRDLFNLFLNPWLLLEVGYLCATIGVCSSRYSTRQLSLSRPRFNVRAGLAMYFPDQFGHSARQHGKVMTTTDVAMAPVAMTAVPSKRKVLHVRLSPDVPSEINFRELVRSLEDASGRQEQQHQTEHNGPVVSTASVDDLSSALAGPRSQRYNIIERLEKRYGGGAIVDCSDTAFGAADGGNGAGSGFERGEEDDYYDSEDSFIDDEELQQNIEDIHGQAHVKTKHSGFFVNAGDEIETIEKDDGDDMDDAGTHRSSKKSKRGSGTESSKAVKAFLDEWSDAASDWTPEPEVIAKLEALRDAVREPIFEAIIEDRDVAEKLHFVLAAQDEWINKENDYRQMLKTEDKKNLKEQDYVALNLRQEKNRIFNRVLGLFSSGLMDLPTLRSMNKAAKSKLPRKPAAQAKGAATGAAVKRKNPSATTPTASLPSPVPP
uniref:Hpc2-related domain-containing protein n=1 Tax=Globisporangium ultimum (strain ATCC 200006 / CBS 805.95 / DAOM BR144) TaxID=431595 RepID=K3WPJ0_GLOUD